MNTHSFLFTPGIWLGEGSVSFSVSPDQVRFYTKWIINPVEEQLISCEQTVEMAGIEEKVVNYYTLSDMNSTSFAITLENDMLEEVLGTGVVDEKKVAWEFRQHDHFEGFEIFAHHANGEYSVHAEFASPDQFRTIIDGRIWQQD